MSADSVAALHLHPHPPRVLLDRFFHILHDSILPLTREGVKAGNRVFGAAILRKDTLETVCVGTNRASESPLYHGEVSCLNAFYALPAADRPATADCIFLSTHEPCTWPRVVVSTLAWS